MSDIWTSVHSAPWAHRITTTRDSTGSAVLPRNRWPRAASGSGGSPFSDDNEEDERWSPRHMTAAADFATA